MAGVGSTSDHHAVNDGGRGSRRPDSEPRRSRQGTVMAGLLLVIAIGLTAAIFGPENIPPGVDGEWLWTRHSLPEDLTSFLDRSFPALVAAAVLMNYGSFLERRNTDPRRSAVAGALLLRTLAIG